MCTNKIYMGGVNDMVSERKIANTHSSNRGGVLRK